MNQTKKAMENKLKCEKKLKWEGAQCLGILALCFGISLTLLTACSSGSGDSPGLDVDPVAPVGPIGTQGNPFIGGTGVVIPGTADSDWITYADSTTPITVSLAATGVQPGAGGDTLNSIENVIGATSQINILTGNGDDNTLRGGSSGDTLIGAGGMDTLEGGGGDDTYIFNSGDGMNDRIKDTTGTDKLIFQDSAAGTYTVMDITTDTSATDGFVFVRDNDNLQITARIGGLDVNTVVIEDYYTRDLSTDPVTVPVETVSGTKTQVTVPGFLPPGPALGTLANPFLGAQGSGNELTGTDTVSNWVTYADSMTPITVSLAATGVQPGAGGDTLTSIENVIGATSQINILTGNGDDNTLRGGSSGDTLTGAGGMDTLEGGEGDDILEGGANGDTYIFSSGDGTNDRIKDTTGADKLVFRNSAAGTYTAMDITTDTSATDGFVFVRDNDNLQITARIGGLDVNVVVIEDYYTRDLSTDPVTVPVETVSGTKTQVAVPSLALPVPGSGTLADPFLGAQGSGNAFTGTDAVSNWITYAGTTTPITVSLAAAGTQSGAGGDTLSNIENVIGSMAQINVLTGNGDDNTLRGGSSGDTLTGAVGTDTLEGGGGNDTYVFQQNDGTDTIIDSGGDTEKIYFLGTYVMADFTVEKTGNHLKITTTNSNIITINDYFNGDNALRYNFFFGGTAIATATTGYSFNVGDVIVGTVNNDTLTSTASSKRIYAFAGNDTIVPILGRHTGAGGIIDGGAGIDTLDYSGLTTSYIDLSMERGSTNWDPGTGYERKDDFRNIERIIGTTRGDAFTSGSSNDKFEGEGGNDNYYFRRDGGTDAITDTEGTSGLIFVNPTSGGQYANAGFAFARVAGSSNLRITASIAGSVVNTVIVESYFVSPSNNAPALTVNLVIRTGGTTSPSLRIGLPAVGGSTIVGIGTEANPFIGTYGADAFSGSTGNDWVSYVGDGTNLNAGVTINLSSSGSIGEAQGDTYTGINNVIGSDQSDVITGDANKNIIYGGGGDDLLFHLGPNTVTSEIDEYNGGSGIDTVSFARASASVECDLKTQTNHRGEGVGISISSDVEILIGSGFSDRLVGFDANADRIDGGNENDLILGGTGNDTLIGGAGNDIFREDNAAGAGNDTYLFGDVDRSTAGTDHSNGEKDWIVDNKGSNRIIIIGSGYTFEFNTLSNSLDTINYPRDIRPPSHDSITYQFNRGNNEIEYTVNGNNDLTISAANGGITHHIHVTDYYANTAGFTLHTTDVEGGTLTSVAIPAL